MTGILRIRYSSLEEFLLDVTANRELACVFVPTTSTFPVGARVDVFLEVPGAPGPIRTRGEVRWQTSEDTKGTPGLGLWLEEPDNTVRSWIDERLDAWDCDEEDVRQAS